MSAPAEIPTPSPVVLGLAVTPHGHLRLERLAAAEDEPPPGVASRIEVAFSRGQGAGILHLGASEPVTSLPLSLAFFRDLGRLWVTALSRMPDAEEHRGALEIPLPVEELGTRVAAAPPLTGLEYLTLSVLENVWRDLSTAARLELAEWRGNVDHDAALAGADLSSIFGIDLEEPPTKAKDVSRKPVVFALAIPPATPPHPSGSAAPAPTSPVRKAKGRRDAGETPVTVGPRPQPVAKPAPSRRRDMARPAKTQKELRTADLLALGISRATIQNWLIEGVLAATGTRGVYGETKETRRRIKAYLARARGQASRGALDRRETSDRGPAGSRARTRGPALRARSRRARPGRT